MGRGRPRGNSTQRAVGRAVGRAMRGSDTNKSWDLLCKVFLVLLIMLWLFNACTGNL